MKTYLNILDKEIQVAEYNYSTAYEAASKIFDTLSDVEKHYCINDGIFKDVPYILRYVIKDEGFIDIYHHSSFEDDVGFVMIAVNPKYRKNGVASKLIKKAIKKCIKLKLDIKTLVWKCNVENEASKKTAEANGFEFVATDDNKDLYKISIYSNKHLTLLDHIKIHFSNFYRKITKSINNIFDVILFDLLETTSGVFVSAILIAFIILILIKIILIPIDNAYEADFKEQMNVVTNDYPLSYKVQDLTVVQAKEEIEKELKTCYTNDIIVHFYNKKIQDCLFYCWHENGIKCSICEKRKEFFDKGKRSSK